MLVICVADNITRVMKKHFTYLRRGCVCSGPRLGQTEHEDIGGIYNKWVLELNEYWKGIGQLLILVYGSSGGLDIYLLEEQIIFM